MSFADKVAIVTGAAWGGIGAAMAQALAREGVRIVVADIREAEGYATAEVLQEAGYDAIFLPVDIASEDSAKKLAVDTYAHFGRIDYLVNNAALFAGMSFSPLMSIDWAELKHLVDVNLLGGLNVTRAVVPYMVQQGGGAIVSTSSTAAWMGGGHYSIAKLGINSITVSLARELAPLKIRVNAIAPGPTDTPALHRQTPPQYRDAIVTQLPLQRLAAPEEQAAAAVFLLSDKASYITGSILNVDGGHVARL